MQFVEKKLCQRLMGVKPVAPPPTFTQSRPKRENDRSMVKDKVALAFST